MEYTKEVIKEKLSTDIRWMERGLIVLFERQTSDEQKVTRTRHENGVGFNKSDSPYLSYVSKYVLKGGKLSGHHIEKVSTKLPKYWRQIQDEINKKREGV